MPITTAFNHTADLDKGAANVLLRQPLSTLDANAHVFVVEVKRGSESADLTGARCEGWFVRADGVTVPIDGEIVENTAIVTLLPACYEVPGRFALAVKLALGDVIHTILRAEGSIDVSRTDALTEGGTGVQSFDEIVASLEAVFAAVQITGEDVERAENAVKSTAADALRAEDAAERAEEAAERAEQIGGTGGGTPGGYYMPSVTQTDDATMRVSYQASTEGMPSVSAVDITLPAGPAGAAGSNGKDGVSATHSWSGTTLTVTSASGTSSANLKGDKGDKGDTGSAGSAGKDGTSVTVSNVSTSTADGGSNVITFSDGKTLTVKNGSKGSTGATGPAGKDGVSPTVTTSKSGKVTTLTIKDASGTKTATINDGADGSDATVTRASIKNALGYTPMNPDSAFTTRQDITPDYTNLIDIYGYTPGKHMDSTGALEDNARTCVSGFIPVKIGDVIRIKDPGSASFDTTLMVALYEADKATTTGIGRNIDHLLTASNNDLGVASIDGDVLTWKLDPINYWYWRNFAYMRVSASSTDMIVTINQPLTESVKDLFMLRPDVRVSKDSLEIDVSSKPLVGKTVVGFGDSIFGYVRDSSSVLSYVAKETGATVHNVGFGGCRMSTHPTNGYAAFSMWALAKAVVDKDWTTQDAQAASGSSYFAEHLALLKSIDFNAVDIVIIHYGSNDFTAGNGVQIDNASDPDDYTTMCGALRYSVDKLLGAYPHLLIYVDLPCYFYKPDTGVYAETITNTLGKHFSEYLEALRATAAEYKLPVIDCYYGLGVNKHNVAVMTGDGAHHSLIGRQRLGELIAGHLNSRQASGKSGTDTAAVNALIAAAIGDAMGGAY